jgi:hypothetical protein
VSSIERRRADVRAKHFPVKLPNGTDRIGLSPKLDPSIESDDAEPWHQPLPMPPGNDHFAEPLPPRAGDAPVPV